MYAKLFASIYQGTLRGNTHGLVVFTNLLAHADASGWVDIHPRAIAEEVGLSIEQVQAALTELESPDPDSRSPEQEGRRILRMDEHRSWGWIVVNHGKYRAIRNEEDRREQNRLAQKRFRDKKLSGSNQSKQHKPRSAQAEAEAEAEAVSAKAPPAARSPSRKKPMPNNFGISDRVRAWAKEKGYTQLEAHFENFVGKVKAKGYTYADWDEGFMGAIRNNWAKLTPPVAPGPKKLTVIDRADLDYEKKYGTAESLGHLMQKLGVSHA